MYIFGRNDQSYEFDGIEDICCERFKELYEEDYIVADRYEEKIMFRFWHLYLEEINKYELSYCPFCGRKIDLKG